MPGPALTSEAWSARKAQPDRIDFPETAWAAFERLASSILERDVLEFVENLLHRDWVRLGPGNALEKGANASEEAWRSLVPFFDALDLSAPAMRRVEATAAEKRSRKAWAEAAVLPLVACVTMRRPIAGPPGRAG